MKYIISVLCPDRPGIISNISSAIFKYGGNICDINQTVLKGFFTGVAYVVFSTEPDISLLEKEINFQGEYKINIVPFRENTSEIIHYDKYILTVKCREQKGIVAAVTNYLYSHKINIESLSAFTEEDEFLMVLEISVPEDKIAVQIKKDLNAIGDGWDMTVHLSHENIYLATNTVCPTVRIGKN